MPEDRYLVVNGVKLRYIDYGSAGKPVAVFYHATGFVSELWGPVVHALRDRYHCIALDQRGHGRSDKSASEYTWHTTADDFRAFARALDLRDAVAIGHSSGATTISLTAAEEPQRIARLVFVEPTVRPRDFVPPPPGAPNPMVERTLARRNHWHNRDAVYATLFARPPYVSWTNDAKAIFADHAMITHPNGEMELACPPAVEASGYNTFQTFDPWPYLTRLTQPVLVIRGAGPSTMPTARVHELMPVLRHARQVDVVEGGHLVLMEAPHRIVEAVVGFLAET